MTWECCREHLYSVHSYVSFHVNWSVTVRSSLWFWATIRHDNLRYDLAFCCQGCNSSTFPSEHPAADRLAFLDLTSPQQLADRWTAEDPLHPESSALSSASEGKHETRWGNNLDVQSERSSIWRNLSAGPAGRTTTEEQDVRWFKMAERFFRSKDDWI